MNTLTIGPKDIAETKTVEFVFAQELAEGETLVSVAVAATVTTGTDPTPQAICSGAAVVLGSSAFQKIVAGVKDVTYHLRALGTTNLGNVHTVAADLKVVEL